MTMLCSPATGRLGDQMPSSQAFTCGRPQRKTKTVRIIQGSQALNT